MKVIYKGNDLKKFTKYALLALIPSVLLTSCYDPFRDPRYEKEYGTIQKFLSRFAYPEKNFIYFDTMIEQNDRNKYYDSEGSLFLALFSLEGVRGNWDDSYFYKNKDIKYFRYYVPFDDVAYLQYAENGFVEIFLGPDLSPSYRFCYKTDPSLAPEIMSIATNICESYKN